MPSLHPVAAAGFDAAAEAYERGRPGYPRAALAPLAISPEDVVVDLAAGTGKLTRELVGGAGMVVAVEPVAGMRTQLRRAVPAVRAVAGVAEALPLRDASLDVVTVATAFHWFDAPAALAEMARVLVGGAGRLGLLANRLADEPPWWGEVDRIVQSHRPDLPFTREAHDRPDWATLVAANGCFTALERHDVIWSRSTDVETEVADSLSVSWMAALPPDPRTEAAEEVRRVLRNVPGPLVLSERTEVHVCRRR